MRLWLGGEGRELLFAKKLRHFNQNVVFLTYTPLVGNHVIHYQLNGMPSELGKMDVGEVCASPLGSFVILEDLQQIITVKY